MIIERTEDLGLIERICLDADVFRWITDDDARLYLNSHPRIHYFLVKVEEPSDIVATVPVTAGFVAFTPENVCTWIPHVALLLPYRGHGLALNSMKAGIDWMFKNTGCEKLTGRPASYNTRMIALFHKLGFHQEGLCRDSWKKDSVLYDRVCFGMEKARWH